MEIHPIPKPPPGAEPVLPEATICYMAGSTGLFKQVRNAFYSACVKVEGVGALAALKEDARLHVPLLPVETFRGVEAFFMEVYAKYRSEAVVLLFCDPQAGTWEVVVPEQHVRGLHVEYDLTSVSVPRPGLELFGSIHSHANIKAFHSGTDDRDEGHFDGLHITIGNVDQPVRSYACRWMLAGRPFTAELGDVLTQEDLPRPSPDWLSRVKPVRETVRLADPLWWRFGEPPEAPLLDLQDEVFTSQEEYCEYLEQMRDEIDQRLFEAETQESEGTNHAAKR